MSNHKWGKKPHRLCHEQECEKCGCIKDTRVIGYTTYTMPNGDFFPNNAPGCIDVISEKEKEALRRFHKRTITLAFNGKSYWDYQNGYVQFSLKMGKRLIELGFAEFKDTPIYTQFVLTDLGKTKLNEFFPEIQARQDQLEKEMRDLMNDLNK